MVNIIYDCGVNNAMVVNNIKHIVLNASCENDASLYSAEMVDLSFIFLWYLFLILVICYDLTIYIRDLE